MLEGYLVAFLNIDEVIAIIRNEDEPKAVLMKRFGLSEVQANAILDLRLRHLAKLEEMRIRGEQDELAEERESLEKTLKDRRRLKRLIRDEIIADAEKYGDERRSPIKEREAALAIDQTAMVPSEAITVVLSERGWVRAAKGHDIDPLSLGYKSGDAFKAADWGRSNQSAVFLDSTGRAYTLPAHTLPSARGQGEPLSGRVKPPSGAVFAGVMIGDPDDRYLLASDAGYGFVARLGDLYAKNKAGKAVLTRPNNAGVLPPQAVGDNDDGWVAAVTSAGYLLVTELGELPLLGRGKGLKIVGIPPARLKAREEYVVAMAVVPDGGQLTVHAGKRHVTLKAADLEHYRVGRGRRGRKLPRGLQRVERLVAGD